jgi:hypothetical protein
MISSVLRNVGRFLVWGAVVVAAVWVNVWAIPEHYLQVKGGLEMAGFEQQELYRDPLVGRIFGPFFPEATLPLAMALTLALGEALGLYLWFYEIFDVLALAGHRHESRLAGRAEEVREATRRIVQSVMKLLFMSALLFWAIRWDVEIFRFRSLASALGPEGPATPGDVASWDLQLQNHASQYVVWLAQYGAWGYIAITAVGCLALEWAFLNLGISFAQVMRPVDEAWDRWVTQEPVEPEMAGFDATTAQQPVDAEAVPAAVGAYPAADPAIPTSATAGVVVADAPSIAESSREMAATPIPAQAGTQMASPPPSSTPYFDPTDAALPLQPEPATPRPQVRAVTQAPRYDVIGSVPPSRVTLEEALADQSRYHVDRAQGRVTIWGREYWHVLRNHHAPNPVSENEEAPV